MKCGMLQSCKETQKQKDRKNGKSKRKSKGEKNKGKANLRPSRRQLSSALLCSAPHRQSQNHNQSQSQSSTSAEQRRSSSSTNIRQCIYVQVLSTALHCVCAPGIGFPIVTAPLELGLLEVTELQLRTIDLRSSALSKIARLNTQIFFPYIFHFLITLNPTQTYRPTDRQRSRQTDRQTYRQTEKQTDRQTDVHTDRQNDI